MSKENVESVQRMTDYFNENAVPGPIELFDPEFTFTSRGDVGSPQTFVGHQGLLDALASFSEVWDRIDSHLIESIARDDVVVAVFRFEVHSHGGVDLRIEEGWAYWFREGKVVRVEQHGSKEKALEAAGLSE